VQGSTGRKQTASFIYGALTNSVTAISRHFFKRTRTINGFAGLRQTEHTCTG